GDGNFDGTVSGSDYLRIQIYLFQAASYSNGDYDFSGIVDSGDVAIYVNSIGYAPAPAEEKLSLRVSSPVEATSGLPYVLYASRENSNSSIRPTLTVDQPVDLIATKFAASSSGQLELTYSVLNE